MNVVDSSAWLAWFANTPNADAFAPAIENTEELIVPTITLYEVFKRVLQQRGEGAALQATALMKQGRVVELTEPLALSAAHLGVESRLPLADCIIYATARAHEALLWTQDADFEGLPGVHFFPKTT